VYHNVLSQDSSGTIMEALRSWWSRCTAKIRVAFFLSRSEEADVSDGMRKESLKSQNHDVNSLNNGLTSYSRHIFRPSVSSQKCQRDGRGTPLGV
jgi:hypothetical protein